MLKIVKREILAHKVRLNNIREYVNDKKNNGKLLQKPKLQKRRKKCIKIFWTIRIYLYFWEIIGYYKDNSAKLRK